jgi:hypothetical protein
MKSVWRHRKAGVCSTSTTAATSAHLGLVVHVGEHGHAELAPHLGQDLAARARMPGAAERRAAGLRLALS